MLSDPVAIAALGSAGTIILSLSTLVGTIKNAGKHNEQLKKQDEIHAETKTINQQTNGTLTAIRAELSAALSRIDTLQQAIQVLQSVNAEKDKSIIIKQREGLEGKIMEVMQENASVREDLIKAKVSPALKPEEL